jgi:hypothetical protein
MLPLLARGSSNVTVTLLHQRVMQTAVLYFSRVLKSWRPVPAPDLLLLLGCGPAEGLPEG